MLVLSGERGVAAVAFTKAIEEGARNGVAYRYRFQPADGGKELTGEGEVFEVDRRNPNANPPEILAWRTVIKAGPIELVWSRGDAKKGWVYYAPEKLRVQIAAPTTRAGREGPEVDNLDRIDLARFRK